MRMETKSSNCQKASQVGKAATALEMGIRIVIYVNLINTFSCAHIWGVIYRNIYCQLEFGVKRYRPSLSY